MRAINIISIVISVAGFFVAAYYMEETWKADLAEWMAEDWYGDYSYYQPYYGPTASEVSRQGAMIMMILTLFACFVNIANLVKVKTITSKVLAIIGISLAGIVFFVNIGTIIGGYDFRFDWTTGPIWMIFAFPMLAFSIVFLIQSVMILKKKPEVDPNQQTIDDIIAEDEVI